jgi:hypothetical protein
MVVVSNLAVGDLASVGVNLNGADTLDNSVSYE